MNFNNDNSTQSISSLSGITGSFNDLATMNNLSYYISSNILQIQKYINSNSITDILTPYDTIPLRNNALSSYTTTSTLTTLLSGKEANLIFNSPLTRSVNTISLDLSGYLTTGSASSIYINSNILKIQNYINSNSIEDNLKFYVSSNTLKDQNYINSNSIEDNLSFYISSNTLKDQNYVSSNQIYKQTDTYSIEREYPPQVYDSVSTQTTTTFLGITPVYTETLTLNTASYGNGDYVLYSSTVYSGRNKYLFLDKNLTTFGGWAFIYTQPAGTYAYNGTTNNSYIENGYYGEWIIIKFPSPLILNRYKFRFNTIQRAPSLFRFYGSMDGVNFTQIIEASNDTIPLVSGDYPSNIYEKILNTSFNTLYLYIGFCCNKIVGGDSTATTMLLQEFYIYGKEKLETLTLPIYISSNILSKQNYINSNSLEDNLSFYVSSNILQTQIYKFDTYSVEQQYPPKLYNTFTTQTATTFLGQASFQESITLNSTGISYGVGNYNIYVSSSSLASNRAGKQLFNYILNEEADSCHFTSVYNASGFYTGTADYIIQPYYGDWCIIKLPNPIILTKFAFYMRPTQTARAPSLWKCYGSMDGITFTEIVEASNSTTALTSGNYTASKYQKILNTTFNTPYLYIGFCYNKITGSGGAILNFSEIQIFGKELIETPFYINSNSIQDNFSFYISSNTLKDQNYINSNSIQDNLSFYISSNLLSKQRYINSNSIEDNLRFYVSSNIINDILLPYDTIGLRNSALNSYLTTASASSTYATITNLNLKENALTFSAPLTRATNTIGIDLSTYSTTTNMNTALSSYPNYTYLNAYSSNYISSNIIANVLTPYDTIGLRNTALGSYLPLSGGTLTGNIVINATNPAFYFNSVGGAGLGQASATASFSTSSAIGDCILRSQATKKLILQSGSGAGSIIINSANDVSITGNITNTGTITNGSGSYIYAGGLRIGGWDPNTLYQTGNIGITVNTGSTISLNMHGGNGNILSLTNTKATITQPTEINNTLTIYPNTTTLNGINLYTYPNSISNSNGVNAGVNLNVVCNTTSTPATSPFINAVVDDGWNGINTIITLACTGGANSGYNNGSRIILDGSYGNNASKGGYGSTLKFQSQYSGGWQNNMEISTASGTTTISINGNSSTSGTATTNNLTCTNDINANTFLTSTAYNNNIVLKTFLLYPTLSGSGGYYLIDVYNYSQGGYCYIQLSVSSSNFYWLGRVFVQGASAIYFANDWYSGCSTGYLSNYGRLCIMITPSTGPTAFQIMNVRIIG